ncbi:MAG: peptidoglycan recognition family protein [Bacillota bacterium]|nr:peptidoglycan recognition family protein [Bacillota bacterium]
MPYQISEQLIKFNRSGQSLSPQGFVIHSTDTPNATAQNEHDYFNSGNRQASAHYFVDSSSIIRCIPENEVAWHAGTTANHRFLSVEMCDVESFQEVWNRTVWLVADACVRYGWTTGPNVYSHRGISAMYKETDHTDPIQFLANHGKTWDQLLAAIDSEIENVKKGVVKVAEAETPKKIIAPDDIYLSVRVRESLADQAILDINKLGFAAKKMDLA